MDLAESFFGDAEVSLGFAAAFGGGVAEGGSDQALALEPIEGRVDAADGDIAAAVTLEFARDGNAVSSIAEMEDGEEDHEFEFTEVTAVWH